MSIPLLIVFAAIAMVVGPILLLRPSKCQRKQKELRDQAIRRGLRVQLMPTPDGVANADTGQMVAVYSLPWQQNNADVTPWLLVRSTFAHELHFCGVWQWFNASQARSDWHQPLLQIIDKLPDGVLAVGNGPQGLHVYWLELGTVKNVELICALLDQLALHKPPQ